jgi:hypothetical protein
MPENLTGFIRSFLQHTLQIVINQAGYAPFSPAPASVIVMGYSIDSGWNESSLHCRFHEYRCMGVARPKHD